MNATSGPPLGRNGAAVVADRSRVLVELHSWAMRPSRTSGRSTGNSTERYLRLLEDAALASRSPKGVLYGLEGPVGRKRFARAAAAERWRASVLIVPKDGWGLDLTRYVRRVMAGAQRDLGFTLEWAAINHRVGYQPHAHVVLRDAACETDKRPQDSVLLAKLGEHAERIASERSSVYDHADREWDAIFQARFTEWDFRIAEMAADGRIPFESIAGDGNLATRLESLEMMQLAELDLDERSKELRGGWNLVKGWMELLLDWGSDDDTADMASVFAAARDALPWRATVSPRLSHTS